MRSSKMPVRYLPKIIILLFIISTAAGQRLRRLEGNIFGSASFLSAIPQGELLDNIANNGLGLSLNGGFYIGDGPLGLGVNLSLATYGNLTRKIPYSYYTDLITLTESTKSEIITINPYVKPRIKIGSGNIYAKFFGGYQMFITSTSVKNDDQVRNNDNSNDSPYIARSDISRDGSFNYGYGFGFDIPIIHAKSRSKKTILLNFEAKWSTGGEAEYLNAGKEGSIVFSDPAQGPVKTTYYPERSKTDLLLMSLGVGF